MLLLALSAPALAADCAAPYTVEALLGDLTGVETGLRTADDASATASSTKLRDGLPCLNEVLPAMIAARTYRAVAGGLFAGGDTEASDKWFRTALELDPGWIYGIQDLPEDHPIRDEINRIKDEGATDVVALEGQDFPEESKQYLDGRKLGSPKARLDRFHLFQREGDSLTSHLIEGNAFPADAMVAVEAPDPGKEPKKPKKPKGEKTVKDGKDPKSGKPGKEPKAKKPKKPKGPKTKVGPNGEVIYKRQRPVEKTPLMIAGAVVMVGAGAIYYGAMQSAKKFNSITTAADVNDGVPTNEPFLLCGSDDDPGDGCFKSPREEAKRLAGNTNRLVLASAAVFAVGAGTLAWGVIVDDSGAAIPTVNFRW